MCEPVPNNGQAEQDPNAKMAVADNCPIPQSAIEQYLLDTQEAMARLARHASIKLNVQATREANQKRIAESDHNYGLFQKSARPEAVPISPLQSAQQDAKREWARAEDALTQLANAKKSLGNLASENIRLNAANNLLHRERSESKAAIDRLQRVCDYQVEVIRKIKAATHAFD